MVAVAQGVKPVKGFGNGAVDGVEEVVRVKCIG